MPAGRRFANPNTPALWHSVMAYLGWMLLVIGICPIGSLPAWSAEPADQPAATPPAAAPAASEKPDPAKSDSEKPAADKPDADKPDAEKKADAPAKGASPGANPADDEYYELYQIFVDTLDQVERNYVKPVSRRELMEAAIEGVLSKLDPYSSYISREEISRFKSTVESQFGGIGIDLAPERDPLQVSSPLVGTPAYRAGMEAGDKILEIDGQTTTGLSHEDCVRKLRGEVGTSVTLSIQHKGADKPESVTLTREVIHVDTVRGDHRKADDTWDYMLNADQHVGYIRISAFSRDTAHDLKRAMQDLESRGLKGLIIDLRFNPGGLLTSAIEISDMFVAEGRIVSTQGRNTPERAWDAEKPGTFEGFPIVILVNRYSASASEIVAACLQDHHRAVVVGERTWGKGSVQNVIEMENGRSALKLTTASYKRPNGKNIHRFPDAKETDEWGVHPDEGFEVKIGPEEMTELIHDRRQRDILLPHAKVAAATPDAAAPPPAEAKPTETKTEPPADGKPADGKPFVDRQLEKALDYLTQQLARAQ